jgi:RNA polymerase sigma-70 factor, ECF subfamily
MKPLSPTKFTENEIASLVLEHRAGLYSSILRRVYYDFVLAEDLTQDAIIKIILALRQGKYRDMDDGSLKAWMVRIGVNEAVSYHRKEKNNPAKTDYYMHPDIEEAGGMEEIFSRINSEDKTIEEDIISKETVNRLELAVSRIPEDQRKIFNLRVINGYRFTDIIEETGLNPNTARGMMRRARISILEVLAKAG